MGELRSRVPAQFETYYEPFLGAGALFFELKPARAELSDINAESINAFQIVKSDTDALIKHLASHRHSKSYFYKIRKIDRDGDYWTRSAIERASRLIYLNKTCFNGLYRVNSRGEFNVPFGDYENPKIIDDENLLLCAEALKDTALFVRSFEDIESRITPRDFVYFDPPYAPLSETSNFASYTSDGFTLDDHRKLADLCRRLDQRKVRFMLSNSLTPLIEELYGEFRVETVLAARAINSKGDRRGKIDEIIVTNYLT